MCGVSTTLGSVSRAGCTAGLAFEDIQPGGRHPARSRSAIGQCRVVDDAAAGDVGQRGARLHLRQLGRADGVVAGAEYGSTSTRWSASRSKVALST